MKKKFLFCTLLSLSIIVSVAPFEISAAKQTIKIPAPQTVQNIKQVEPSPPEEPAVTQTPVKESTRTRVERLSVQLVQDIKQLDTAIIEAIPSVEIASQPEEYVSWTPTVILRKGTSESKQKEIAIKLTEYVVKFQYNNEGNMGISSNSMGGIFAFIKGEDWNPSID